MSEPAALRCLGCDTALPPYDAHDRCPPCMGLDHAISAFERGPGCPFCDALDASALLLRYELAKQRPRGPAQGAILGVASSAGAHGPRPSFAAPASHPTLAYHGGAPLARAARSAQPLEFQYVASTSGVERTNSTPACFQHGGQGKVSLHTHTKHFISRLHIAVALPGRCPSL